MANIKSAKKRVITSQVRADRNKAIKSKVKTYIKKVDAAVAAGDKAAAESALPVAIAEISKAASKGIFHKNTAARNKAIRSEVKTSIKKVEAAVAANDKEAAKAALTVAISTIESASSKGIYHKNNSARKVSRLTKLVNGLA